MSSAAGVSPGKSLELSAVAIIPARLGSTRLPRKMLLRETGSYLFEHTARNVAGCTGIGRVVVATDSDEIVAAGEACGVEVLATSPEHRSGTDRIFEAWCKLKAAGGSTVDVIINVQGDEPDLAAEDLERLVRAFEDPEVELASLWAPIEKKEDLLSPHVVKVVLDEKGDALYFSRSPLPNSTHARPETGTEPARRHLGVYAFRPAALERFCDLPPGKLEQVENLEQLRWLEAGGRLRVLRASHRPFGIDTAEDYQQFVTHVLGTQGTEGTLT